MHNLPDGVRVTDIPGNRPQDVAHDRCMEAAWDELPARFVEVKDKLVEIEKAGSAPDFASACHALINLFEPTPKEMKSAERCGQNITRADIFEEFLQRLGYAAAEASYFENPPEPEYDRERDDYYE